MSAEPQKPNEVLVEGVLYDVTEFRHPGGSIIKFMQGHGDATEAFREFHSRSTVARKRLAKLPNRPAPPQPPTEGLVDIRRAERNRKLSAAFIAFRRQLEAEGMFKPSSAHIAYRMLELVVMHAVGLWLVFSTPLWLFGLVMLGIAEGRCGWLMHEGGHHSMTGIIPIDVKLQEVIYGFGCGMSGAWWRVQHNKHHAAPQKLNHDVDLDTLPLVAFNAAIAKLGRGNSFMRLWLPLQQYLFPVVTCSLVALFWQLYLHPRHMVRTQRVTEMASVAARYAFVWYLGCVVAGLTVMQTVGFYLLYQFFGAGYIFINFALSHTHLPVSQKNDFPHWLEFGSKYTIDITPNFFTNWWMAYLNFQIEHHLFPSMPQFRFAIIHPRVRKFFEENGLKYDCRDYFAAMSDTFRNLAEAGKEVLDENADKTKKK
jgi:fatty acid desaturase